MKQKESVRNIMSTKLVTAAPHLKFSEIKKLMESNGIRHLPVVAGKKLLGIISKYDVLRVSFSSAFGDAKDTEEILDQNLKLSDFMTKEVICLKDTDSIKQAVRVLSQQKFHSLPIVNNNDELVGIISSVDLLRYFLEQYAEDEVSL